MDFKELEQAAQKKMEEKEGIIYSSVISGWV